VAEVQSGAVITPSPIDSRLCPVCQKIPLTGRRAICSSTCRVRRWQAKRDARIRKEAVAEAIAALRRLEDSP
jgi:hypothetical protein